MIPPQQLVEKWRKEADDLDAYEKEYESHDPVRKAHCDAEARRWRRCAKELEAALAAGGARAPQWQPAVLAWLGFWRDSLDPKAVAELQDICAAASGAGPSPPHEAEK